MWIMTTKGFFSAVQHRDDPTKVMVRARVKEDIDALIKDYLPEAKPEKKVHSDYEWRITVTAAEWAGALAQMALDVDYPNFKSAVSARQGHARSAVYMSVWSDLLRLERPGRYQEKWGGGGAWPKVGNPVKRKSDGKIGVIKAVFPKGVNAKFDTAKKARFYRDKAVIFLPKTTKVEPKERKPDTGKLSWMVGDRVTVTGNFFKGDAGEIASFDGTTGVYVVLDSDADEDGHFFYEDELVLEAEEDDAEDEEEDLDEGEQQTLHLDSTSGGSDGTIATAPPKSAAEPTGGKGKKRKRGKK